MDFVRIERWTRNCCIAGFVAAGIAYGGSKHPTGAPQTKGGRMVLAQSPRHVTQPFVGRLIANWTARGAWNDWTHLGFPEGFAFPLGTNLLTGVTVMSQGALRASLDNPEPIAEFPLPLAIEPGASAVRYGLTSSNSFVVAWTDACLGREATNRIDAAFELFANGDVTVRYGDTVTNIVARPPEGFVGNGQDDAWALATFPDDYAAITNKGYEAWLMEDKVGINEQNGIYQAKITIGSILTNHPTYLVCGPYRVAVNGPGTYSFPLEVFNRYEAFTLPVELPLEIAYDDGYRSEGGMLRSVRRTDAHVARRAIGPASSRYLIEMFPDIVIEPLSIPLSSARGTVVSIWCNVAEAARSAVRVVSDMMTVTFVGPTQAQIDDVISSGIADVLIETPLGSCSGSISVYNDIHCTLDGCTCWNCSCGSSCTGDCLCWLGFTCEVMATNGMRQVSSP